MPLSPLAIAAPPLPARRALVGWLVPALVLALGLLSGRPEALSPGPPPEPRATVAPAAAADAPAAILEGVEVEESYTIGCIAVAPSPRHRRLRRHQAPSVRPGGRAAPGQRE